MSDPIGPTPIQFNKSMLLKPPPSNIVQSDKKNNLVLYGIKESPKDTLRLQCIEHDLEETTKILTLVVATFNPMSIKDFYRLGQFKPNQCKPRPLLLKFL